MGSDHPAGPTAEAADWTRRRFYATMRWIFRDRSKPEAEQVPAPAPFYKHRRLSREQFEDYADKYAKHALPRLRHHPDRRHRAEDPRVMEIVDEIHELELAAPRVFSTRPTPARERDFRLWRLAWTLVFATSGAAEARVRRALREAIGRRRTRLANRCRALLCRNILPPLKATLDVLTNSFDLPRYQGHREFLWTFLREEARAALGARRLASVPQGRLLTVACELRQAYPWVSAAAPAWLGPPPPLTAKDIAAGLPTGLYHRDPAEADTAKRFGFFSADSLRVSRTRRRRR